MTFDHDPTELPWQKKEKILYGGLAGLATASLLALVQQEAFDCSLTVAIFCFAVAIPFLVAGFLAVPSGSPGRKMADWEYFLNLVGVLSAIAGFAAIFIHFALPAGFIFIGCTLLNLLLIFSWRRDKRP